MPGAQTDPVRSNPTLDSCRLDKKVGQAPPLPTLAPQAVVASLELAAVRRQTVKLFWVLKGEPHSLGMRPL